MKTKHPNCDGAHCRIAEGEVRKLPTGGGGNSILCRSCFNHEMDYRQQRNATVPGIVPYDIPEWENLEIVDPTGGEREYHRFTHNTGHGMHLATAYLEKGVWRWASNDRVVPIRTAREYKIPIDNAAQKAAESAELAEILRRYRETYKRPSADEQAEARAAHGPGVRLVNVITGDRFTT